MKFVVDMNLSPRWASWLAERGHEARHWSEVGPLDAADSTILEWARARGYAVLTHDLDFGDILAATGGAAPSVVQLRSGSLAVGTLGPLVEQALLASAAELAAGALVTIDAARHRVRLLPLTSGAR